jgi:hypothetical protein
MTSNIDRLEECFCNDVSVTVITWQGRKYAVTQGTGEMNFGADGGGSAAFAYAVSDLRAADLRPDGWSYSDWCDTISPVEDVGLARKLAREHGMRLTRAGSCQPVLDDAEFSRIRRTR